MPITKAISSHTPGPWTFEPQDGHPGHGILAQVFGPDDNSIADIDPTYPPTVANANARLIAAAPELLEALQNIENDAKQIPDHAWALIQAAIAKATVAP